MAQKGPFIVYRLLVDGHASGSDVRYYQKVDKPSPGETIYHGQFSKQMVETSDNGPMGSTYAEVYYPVDPDTITSEKYVGDGGGDVETF